MSAGVPTQRIREALQRAGQFVSVQGTLPHAIHSITDDSRKVEAGCCFVAVRGSARDGHEFLPLAEAGGASLALIEAPPETAEDEAPGQAGSARGVPRTTLPAMLVRESRVAAAVAAAAFHGEPAASLRFVGVTGTNGKTTTVGIVRHLLDSREAKAASIGTLGVLIGSEGREFPGGAGLTTPGPIELQRVLRGLVDDGVKVVAMEVSSHALDQQRVLGVRFDAAIFTNLTRDHLDYHGTMEGYLAAKARLVGLLSRDGTGVINADDSAWLGLPHAPRTILFGLRANNAEVRAEQIRFEPRGSVWNLCRWSDCTAVRLPLIGDFNVANALGAAAAAIALGLDVPTVAKRLESVPQVPGRLEVLSEHPTVLRDYAHTPDALERALIALRPFVPGKLVVLFGCGGDRDRGKRPLMAKAARANADHVVVTSDNPRTEDPERIIDEIVAALPAGSYDRIEDRRAAIAHAIKLADPVKDVVLLAGKGHETYQIRGTTSHPFDEKVTVAELLGASATNATGRGGRA